MSMKWKYVQRIHHFPLSWYRSSFPIHLAQRWIANWNTVTPKETLFNCASNWKLPAPRVFFPGVREGHWQNAQWQLTRQQPCPRTISYPIGAKKMHANSLAKDQATEHSTPTYRTFQTQCLFRKSEKTPRMFQGFVRTSNSPKQTRKVATWSNQNRYFRAQCLCPHSLLFLSPKIENFETCTFQRMQTDLVFRLIFQAYTFAQQINYGHVQHVDMSSSFPG